LRPQYTTILATSMLFLQRKEEKTLDLETYLPVLRRSTLFSGTDDGEKRAMLGCLSARVAEYGRGEFIWRAGETLREVGLVLRGRVTLEQEDYWGNRSILARFEPGQLF